MHVVCTAGHVDHGKSTLVRALTGMEPDRLAEERRRGLTIELGYAWTRIEVGDRESDVAFVDLPGHERFVGTMLAGAGALRRALLVVAADEGWMRQSAEHLAILDLLEVEDGVVVLSRCDLVDAETADIAEELLRDELAGSVLADAPIVRVGLPPDGHATGLDAVRSALARMLAASPPPRRGRRARLWVDRSFTVAGAGTVLTGTLSGGALAEGDDVVLQPAGTPTRVRGLQQLGAPVQRADDGRVAVNVSGLSRDDAGRGDALVRGDWRPTGVADAWVRSAGERPIRRRGAWHLHVGSAERVVRVEPWAGEVGPAGGVVRLRIDPPLPVVAGDRIVLREAGARQTVGGGIVLDPAPPPRRTGRLARQRRVAALERRAAALASDDVPALVAAAVSEAGAARPSDLAAALDLADPAPAARLAALVDLGGWWADEQALARWTDALRATLGAHHAAAPLEGGAPRAVVDVALADADCPADALDAVLRWVLAAGHVVADGPLMRLPDHRVVLSGADAAARDRLVAALDELPFNPPNLDEAAEAARASDAVIRALHADGTLVQLTERLSWTSGAVAAAVARLRAVAADAGPLTASQAKEALGSSRKHVVPLLEELDRRGVTRRVGDRRELR